MGTIELAELEGWDTIQKAISKQNRILEGGSSDLPFTPDENMMLYSTIFNMCTENPDCCQQLYDKYRETLEEYITSSVLPSLREKHGEFLLRELSKRWENHEVMCKWLSKCFDYLERFFVHRDTVLHRSLKVVGITIFRKLVYREFKTKVRYLVLTLIDKEREGEQIDTALLKNVINIFVETGIVQVTSYAIDFERYMLEKSEAYYSHKSSNWILEHSSGFDYMSKVEECLKKERDRVSHYLHSSSEPKLVELVERELVLVHATELLERDHSGFCNLIRDDKVENLSRMYRVYHLLPHVLEPIANFFEQHIAAQGSVQRTKEVFVRELIELNEKYMAYVTDCFQNHRLFRKALKEALKRFCKNAVSGSSSAELLATFCHDILKKGGRGKLSDEVIEDTLEKVVKLLVYIVDIDLFFAFCRRNFACRLLFRQSGNDDHERSFLTKLKQQCGDPFTSKMERMLTDLTLSREIQKNFKEYLKTTGKNPGIDLKVTVLNTGCWPTFRSSYLNLPTEMVKCREVFNDFYKSKTVDRKLKWIYGLGTCLVDGNFEKKTIELSVNTYQAVLLLLFNSSDRLSYSEIMTQLNVTHDDLVRLLHSVSCAKYKILSKDPKTETISRTDYFEFNSEFTDLNRRIKIPFPQVTEKRVIEEVIKSRRYSIECTIVRQMKSQKAMRQQNLVADCVDELRCMFEPDIKEINKGIDRLISREYLERDSDDPNILKYLA